MDKMTKINKAIFLTVLLFMTVAINGCELVGDLIQAGIWIGILIVVGIIGLIYIFFKR
jgi:hypothetical protein